MAVDLGEDFIGVDARPGQPRVGNDGTCVRLPSNTNAAPPRVNWVAGQGAHPDAHDDDALPAGSTSVRCCAFAKRVAAPWTKMGDFAPGPGTRPGLPPRDLQIVHFLSAGATPCPR